MTVIRFDAFVVFVAVTVSALFETVSTKDANEKQLARHIITNYETIANGRPVTNWTEALDVRMAVSLHNIVLDGNYLKATMWLHMSWQDAFIRWNPESFSEQEMIRLPAKHVWKPDISSLTETSDNKADQVAEMELANLIVESHGLVIWAPRLTTETECIQDHSQTGKLNCTFVFGSWSYPSKQLQLNLETGGSVGQMDVKELQLPPGVEILENIASKMYRPWPCCPETSYARLTFRLVLRQWDQYNKCKAN